MRRVVLLAIAWLQIATSVWALPNDPFVPTINGQPVTMQSGDEHTRGKLIETDERRSGVLLDQDTARRYFPDFNSETEIVVGNFRHNKQWYIAKIPLQVKSVYYIDDVLDSLIRGRHGAYRFQFAEGRHVTLVPQVEGNTYRQPLVALDSIVFNLLATGAKDWKFSPRSSQAGNLVGALQFQSVEEHMRRALLSLQLRGPLRSPVHKIEMWEFPLDRVSREEARSILLESAKQANHAFRNGGYLPYKIQCANCVNILFDVATTAVPRFQSRLGDFCSATQDMIRAHGIFATTVFKLRGMTSPLTFPTNIQKLPHLNQYLPTRLRKELGL